LWITIHIEGISGLLAYIDDTFSHNPDPHLLYYPPYDMIFPSKQTHLLHLWDSLGIPHEKKKQEFGQVLTIIGFQVDKLTAYYLT